MSKPILLLDCDGILTPFIHHTPSTVGLAPHHKGYLTQGKPFQEAVDVMPDLKRLANVYIVTSYLKRAPTWCWERDQWLEKHFQILPENIIHTRAKYLVRGDVFVDDLPSNIIGWQHYNPVKKAFLWERSYNTPDNMVLGMTLDKITSWDPVLHYLSYI